MDTCIVPAPLRLKQNSTGLTFTLHPSTAGDWAGQWPTDCSGDVLVSEAPGSADGSLFGYWLGNCTLESPSTLEAIQKHMDDHDVVGIHVIPGFPDCVHSSLQLELARLKGVSQTTNRDQAMEAPGEKTTVLPCDDQPGRFAWAVFADTGNVIIWSNRRDQVAPIAARYHKPITPVVILDRAMVHLAHLKAAQDASCAEPNNSSRTSCDFFPRPLQPVAPKALS